MKKIYVIGVLLLSSAVAFSQVPRVVLLEHFTQASCGPCATYNPAVQTLITSAGNSGKIVAIKYQTSWPGFDPMNLHNPGDVSDRRNLYGINSVPNSVIDGDHFTGHPSDWGQSDIDSEVAEMSPVTVDITHHISSDYDSIYATMKIKADTTMSGKTAGSIKAFIVVTEEVIEFTTAPGSNGERKFYDVMKKILPSTTGQSVPDMVKGDSLEFTVSWELENVYRENEIGVVGFVQDMDGSSLRVIQAAESLPSLVASNTDDVQNVEVVVPDAVCGTEVSPVVVVKNYGSDPLTKVSFDYSVNGGTASSYTWQGTAAIPSFGRYEIGLPAITFTEQASNSITVTAKDPNGNVDANLTNNDGASNFDDEETANSRLILELKLDGYGSETAWTVKTKTGITVAGKSSYSNNVTSTISENIDVSVWGAGCYEFEITDDFGDGLIGGGGNPPGSYKLIDKDGKTLAQGTAFGSGESTPFSVDESTLGIKESALGRVSVYPNPATDQINVSIDLATSQNVVVQLYNVLGSTVMTRNLGTRAAGPVQETLELTNLDSGIYFVNIIAGESTISKKITLK